MTGYYILCIVAIQELHSALPVLGAAPDDLAHVHQEAGLVASLLANHSHMNVVRPSPGAAASEPVVVAVSLDLVGIIDINEKDGHMTTSLFPKMQWLDPRLSWDPTANNGIKQVELPASDVWLPDVEVFNRYGDAVPDNAMHSLVSVTSDGTVTYVPRRHIQTPCHFNLQNFPYDQHECEITMGSWSYDISKINITRSSTSTSYMFVFENARDWDLLGFETERIVASYESGNFTILQSKLTIKRVPNYFYRLYVAPAAVMIFAIPLIHFIPTGSSEKLTLCGSMLVTTTLMFRMLEDLFPAYSLGQVPVLLHYYSSVLLLLFLSMYISCTTGVIAHPGSKAARLPSLLKKFFVDKLGFMCCLTSRVNRAEHHLAHLEMRLKNAYSMYSDSDVGDRQMSQLESRDGMDEDSERPLQDARRDDTIEAGGSSSGGSGSLPRSTSTLSRKQVVKVMQALVSEMQHARYLEGCRLEWQQFATLLDRLSGLMFFVLAAIVTVAIVDISL